MEPTSAAHTGAELVTRFGTVDYVVFVLCLAVSAAIGLYYACSGGKQNSASELLLGNRSMSVIPVAMSILASFISAITLLGTPAEIYQYGTQYMAILLSFFFVIPAAGYIYLPVFYNLGLTSAYQYLEYRFNVTVRSLASFIFSFQMLIYMAIVLYAPALALSQVTGISVWFSVLSIGIVCTFYTSVVCSIHFLDHGPSKENPAPQLSLGYPKKVIRGRKPLRRMHNGNLDEKGPSQGYQETVQVQKEQNNLDNKIDPSRQEVPTVASIDNLNVYTESQKDYLKPQICSQCNIKKINASTQWEDLGSGDHNYCKKYQIPNAKSVSVQVDQPEVSYATLSNNDCLFYTGLQLEVFLALLTKLATHTKSFPFKMETGNQFLLVLLRLRLGLLFEDLGRRFRISSVLAIRIFHTWLPVLCEQMKNVVFWLPRETIRGTLPHSFKQFFPRTTCIMDCTEVFINRPTFLRARAQTYSKYKSHNTIKILVAVAPDGFSMFLSKCFGGRASDKFIVNNSGVLSYILPGDEIMADRGFTIDEELASRGATLNIPVFTKGKEQLSAAEETNTRRIASVRVHVERAIGRIKEYRILKHTSGFGSGNKVADDVFYICAGLCNFKSLLIKRQEVEYITSLLRYEWL